MSDIQQRLFRKGDRVEMTTYARSLHRNARSYRGTVCGFGRGPNLVRVRRDRCVTVQTWHVDFWRAVPLGAEE